jgi:hypothetical protein
MVGFYAFFLFYNNFNNSSQEKIAGFNIPFKFIEYPDNDKIVPYTQFLNETGQDPKEYLLDLFSKYDIVVLCENLHSEDTQWDFIFDVVQDRRFIENVGNVFTEYGSVGEQAKVDSFMRKTIDNDTLLAKETATLTNFMANNFYLFMQKLYRLNQTLPDSLKIQEHFSDILNDNYLFDSYYDSLNKRQQYNPNRPYRDSLMAQIVIDWYHATKKKCLVVTNYRHAFVVNKTAQEKDKRAYRRYRDNEAQYIYNIFPQNTANVMLYGMGVKNVNVSALIQNGKWSRAFKNNHYLPVGFDFKDSPFGKDCFDRFPSFGRTQPFLYEDIFTGFIFYKPEQGWTHSTPYYRKYGAEEEYKWAVSNHLIDSVKGKMLINNYSNQGGLMANTERFPLYINSYHFMDLVIWGIWAVFIAIIVLIKSIILFVRRNR